MKQGSFAARHIGPRAHQENEMLSAVGAGSMDELIQRTIPENIRRKSLTIGKAMTEQEYLDHIGQLGSKNQVMRSFIGMGYYPTVVPPVVLRNVLENPGWYTAYTPYQAEIAQGRLEALLNFQTVISDLTGMELANASLLDEGTAAAEAMIMFYNTRSRADVKAGVNKCFIDADTYPQTLDVIETRAKHLGIELVHGHYADQKLDESFFCALIQYPTASGEVRDYEMFAKACEQLNIKVGVATDLMALTLLTPPGEWGADAVYGNSQRFGVPMGFGGPHAAFYATKESYKRHLPGRIIGVSQDRLGKTGYRMALQTREQHIRRDKATSNICTAQALLAVMASMYAVYHGAEGVTTIAQGIHQDAKAFAKAIKDAGLQLKNEKFFDTVVIQGADQEDIKNKAENAGLNLAYHKNGDIGVSFYEGCTDATKEALYSVFGAKENGMLELNFGVCERSSAFLQHEVFNSYRSETDMMRYMKSLENKDLSLVHSMIPLGSCTMKLNAAAELMPITQPHWSNLHPFAPIAQTAGYREMLTDLEKDLAEVTGFASVSLQPNSGAQGEYAGLLVIRAYHEARGESHRNICLIPSSAHGTNPASSVMAGMEVVVVKCDDHGNVDVEDLKLKADQHRDNLGALMVTYPSTHGVFESAIVEINDYIHDCGGLVYMDGANMNAQVGLTSPGHIGADVCHLNLHKTFAIPHGGGGPGMGPIGVVERLAPFLPGHELVKTGGDQAINAVSAAPWGSALILLISYGYIKMLGAKGLTQSTEWAILNANYIKARLNGHYDVLYQGENGTVAHEMIIDCRSFKQTAGVEVADIAKRLMDYGFHAPTVSFPVAGTLMIEPTESESKEELDRFCDAMIQIREEIKEIETGLYDQEDNVLKMAPHTAVETCGDEWNHAYSRQKAAFPLLYVMSNKYWAPVARVDNAYGDRNLMCTCPPIESFAEVAE